MSHETLAEFVQATADRFGIPGAAVGVWADGREHYACHGVTSLDNPLPVDSDTLFQLGSVTKTYTATALMRLVEQGRVELDAPVRRYVPELELADEAAAAQITVLNLLNHTSGLSWNLIVDTGDGEDALADFVAKLVELPMIAQPGERSSYSQAGFILLGRVIEKVTGLTYEKAIAELVLTPLGLSNSFFGPEEVMARRFAVGHNLDEAGELSIAPWTTLRGNNPGGGLVSSVADQLRWARFHLGDGHADRDDNGDADSAESILSAKSLHAMREQTVALRASTLGDGVGIAWFLRAVDGVRTAGHGGSANGQFAELLIVPERDFAVVSLANQGPDGTPFNQAVVRWALETHLGLVERDPEPLPYDAARAEELVGDYDIDAMTLTIATAAEGLTLAARLKPAIREAMGDEAPADYAPAALGLLPGDGDEYIVTGGGLQGQRGFFTRDEAGAIVGADLAGRLFNRVP